MSWASFALIFLFSTTLWADLTVGARYDNIRGKEEELASRLILKSKLNSQVGPFALFIEGFGEFEGNEYQSSLRRSPSRGYLQEAYLEFRLESFYIRVGRQALRWSESWTLPSLDVWTGRRYNRLFFDPLSDQWTHPTGASFSYAIEALSLDVVAVGDVAEDFYPLYLPVVAVDKNTSFGARAKWNVGGFSLTGMSAQVLKKYVHGLTANYALDIAVPKMEVGYANDTSATLVTKTDQTFGSVGCDFFLGDWVVLPQVSVFEVNSLTGTQQQTAYYVSAQWNPERHDMQMQFYANPDTQDQFASLSYGYNISDHLTASGFVQNYEGQQGLYSMYQEITGGFVVGVRAELTGNLTF